MELIDQNTKTIMEGCKDRARQAGLVFDDETLEYIVSNRDLLELSPKVMIPTLYDYWVHDVEVLKEKGRYELYPGNPYETVINTRPAISFYNDNNPDWLNVMIFYHVLGHIDFFQNNTYFRHTWDIDFTEKALDDKRRIAKLRSEKGRWVDYIIEFSRGIDNLVGYHDKLSRMETQEANGLPSRLDFYFDVFLQEQKRVKMSEYIKEIERYNDCMESDDRLYEGIFFAEVERKYPEFDTLYRKHLEKRRETSVDLIQFIMEQSSFLKKEDNQWMLQVMDVVRSSSMFFQPQIRTKILNEGWASYWHERLFLQDDRIKGHEVDYARINASVTAMPRVGLNPYALGMRLFSYIEQIGDKGKYSYDFKRILDSRERTHFDNREGKGQELIFKVRENLCDFLFIYTFLDQDFVDLHKLFVAGRQLDQQRMVWQYYIKSRRAEDYRNMIFDTLYHPPYITVDHSKTTEKSLYLVHHFEEKPLVTEYIANTMLGIEYLWGAPVNLETSEVVSISPPTPHSPDALPDPSAIPEIKWRRVVYTMKERKLAKRVLEA